MLVFKSRLSELSRDKLKSFQGSEKALNILLDSITDPISLKVIIIKTNRKERKCKKAHHSNKLDQTSR